MNIFIIHGSFGNPGENWFPWLKRELENLGHEVFAPKFPTPENQSLETWLEVFEKYEDKLENSVVIGHSLGPSFLLHVLERTDKTIKAAFFIAPFIKSLGNEEFDKVNRTFYKEFDWGKVRQKCRKFYILHSDNDPYVPLEMGEEIAEKLGTDVIIVKGAGHFNTLSGYNKFPLLLEKIKDEL